jgi:hypothetical protein
MGLIVVRCEVCRQEMDSRELLAGWCLSCRVDALCAEERRTLLELMRKRRRYERKGAPLDGIDRHAARLGDRMRRKIARITPAVADQLGRQLRQIAEQRLLIAP